ncbi:MAG: Rieske 2Fe-2S domain-containing protein, partial [Deltaproteobacteria bacterium]
KPIKILGEEFTLYRGEGGKPHVVDFRCAHRQTQLSVGWVEDDCIRCRFHGWKYDSSGQCIEQPAEKESFAEKIRIRSCPTEEYLKLIFVYFGEGDPPPLPRYPRPAVQLRQQSGKRSDSYSVYAPRVGVLYESPAGDSRHHGRGKRLGRAVNFALSQRAALYHATRAA